MHTISSDMQRRSRSIRWLYGLAALLSLCLVGASAVQAEFGPTARQRKPAVRPVSYEKEIKPLLTARCGACHAGGSRLGGLQIDARDALLKGGQSGPAVVVGKSGQSLLIQLVSGADPKRIMPARGKRLTQAEIDLLRAWIDQGLSFGRADIAAAWTPTLAPRRPKVPAPRPGSGLSNPIDLLLQPYFQRHRITPPPLVEDRAFARRAYLDLLGLLPPPDELRAFLADSRPDKRASLVRRLLADNKNYTEHWLTFWNDMLRNDYAGTGYIDGGRTQITDWLYNALYTNMPYDRFVRELVNPTPESAGFVKGIIWRGVVNASQTPEMQAAQNISQVFLGINLKCASCHDSFISTWKLADAYGMAGIYAEKPLEMVRCDRPTGEVAPIKFLYPQLGQIEASAPREKRMEQLASVLTCPQNGRLARTMVNRLWTKLMGRGLVEPNDDMDRRPWHPDLLDWLASDFIDNGYDVKKTIERIVTSRAYQLPAMALKSERAENFVFRGPVVKRMTAEQFVDAVSTLTGVWPSPARAMRMVGGQPVLPPHSRAAIKFRSGPMRAGSVEIDVDITGAEVLSLIVTDGGNGGNYDWADWAEPRLVGPQGEIRLTDLKWRVATTGYGQVQIDRSVVEKPIRLGEKTYANGIGTHANSIITYLLPKGVTRFRAIAGPDTGATEQKQTETLIEMMVVAGDRSMLETRASLAYADTLMRALGRPNREQVVTQRATVATTLQALELTNGQTLATMLEQGVAKWLPHADVAPDDLLTGLYAYALSRPPTPTERRAALELLGQPVRKEGVEDLLWALVMLPELQLIF